MPQGRTHIACGDERWVECSRPVAPRSRDFLEPPSPQPKGERLLGVGSWKVTQCRVCLGISTFQSRDRGFGPERCPGLLGESGLRGWCWLDRQEGVDVGTSLSPSRGQLVMVAVDICAWLGEGGRAREPWMDSQVSTNSARLVLTFCGWSRSVSSPFHEVMSRGPALETTCPTPACCQVCPAALGAR